MTVRTTGSTGNFPSVSKEAGAGEGGISYTVKVELPSPSAPDPAEISAVATVGEWQAGKPGSGELDGGKVSGESLK